MREMLSFAGAHGIQAAVEVMPMSQVNEALRRVGRIKRVTGSCWSTDDHGVPGDPLLTEHLGGLGTPGQIARLM